jgi:hypothetical protein
VASGEYGYEYLDRMVELIDNGRVISWKPSNKICEQYDTLHFTEGYSERKHSNASNREKYLEFDEEINPKNLQFKCSGWEQFCILFRRASRQIYNDKVSYFISLNSKFKCPICD